MARVFNALFERINLPAAVTLEEAEQLASHYARQCKRSCCLVWTRRLSVWFDKEGEKTCASEATLGDSNTPYLAEPKPFLAGTNLWWATASRRPR